MRISRQQGLAAHGIASADGPGIATFKRCYACGLQGLFAGLGQLCEGRPVIGLQRHVTDYALWVPIHIKDLEVLRPQLVANKSHHRLGLKGCSKAVGQVPGHRNGVLGREVALGDAQQVKLQRGGMGRLELVDAIQVSQQSLVGWCAHVHFGGIALRKIAQPQRAKQPVGVNQLGSQNFCQLAIG